MINFQTYVPLIALSTAGILIALYLIGIGASSFQIASKPSRPLTDLVNFRQRNAKQ